MQVHCVLQDVAPLLTAKAVELLREQLDLARDVNYKIQRPEATTYILTHNCNWRITVVEGRATCTYPYSRQFLLPCRHLLLVFFVTKQTALPLEAIHPR